MTAVRTSIHGKKFVISEQFGHVLLVFAKNIVVEGPRRQAQMLDLQQN